MTVRPDIDPVKAKLDEPIPLHGEPEFLAADRNGRAYVNLMTTNEVAVVDLKSRKVLENWPVAPGGSPVGMAIDETKGLLFIGCRNPQKLIVMSTRDGKVISDMPIGPTVDAVKIDGAQAFATTAGSQLFVAGETSPGKYEIVETVKTGEGAHTIRIRRCEPPVLSSVSGLRNGSQRFACHHRPRHVPAPCSRTVIARCQATGRRFRQSPSAWNVAFPFPGRFPLCPSSNITSTSNEPCGCQPKWSTRHRDPRAPRRCRARSRPARILHRIIARRQIARRQARRAPQSPDCSCVLDLEFLRLPLHVVVAAHRKILALILLAQQPIDPHRAGLIRNIHAPIRHHRAHKFHKISRRIARRDSDPNCRSHMRDVRSIVCAKRSRHRRRQRTLRRRITPHTTPDPALLPFEVTTTPPVSAGDTVPTVAFSVSNRRNTGSNGYARRESCVSQTYRYGLIAFGQKAVERCCPHCVTPQPWLP